MYRKPFRTPFLKTPKRGSDDDNKEVGSDAAEVAHPPKKRLKQADEQSTGEQGMVISKNSVRFTPMSHSAVRPLLGFKPSAPQLSPQKITETVEDPGSGGEIYFNVLWRKYTTKKYDDHL